MNDFDAKLVANARARAKAAEAENALLKVRLATLEARLQKENDKPTNGDDKPPGVPGEDDEELDENGKLKKRKVKAADDKPAEQNEGCDKPRTEDQEEAKAKSVALMVINCYRKALGLPLAAKLVQDESPVPAGVTIDHRDSDAFAKCVVASWRKATGRPPLAANEWVSVRRLRGEG